MQTTSTVDTKEDEGLYELVLGAARAGSESANGALGLVEIALEEDAGPAVAIETEFAWHGGRRMLDSLNVRWSTPVDDEGSLDEALADALGAFGGVAFTNLCVTREGEGDGMDVTVSFSSPLPILARNLFLPPEDTNTQAVSDSSELLDALGVSHRTRGSAIHVPRWQLRSRMRVDQQLDAHRLARRKDLVSSLYVATIPTSQSVRIAVGQHPDEGILFDLVLSQGLSGQHLCTSADAARIGAFFGRYFDFSFGKKHWIVQNSFGQAARPRPEPPRRPGARLFSLGFRAPPR